MYYWRLVCLMLLLLTQAITDNFADKWHQGKQVVARTAHGVQTVCNNFCARIYNVIQTKSAWEATGFSSALQVLSSLWKLFSMRAGEVEISSLLVYTEPQHDQWVVLARLSWITGIPEKAAVGHSNATAQLHPAVAMDVSSWLWGTGVCFMALKHVWIILMIGSRNVIVFFLQSLEIDELKSLL